MSAPGLWARRRAAVAAEAEADALAQAQAEILAREEALAERDDAEILAELDLPDPDTLNEGDDFRAFLTDAVPARIKTRALRRLWLTNPLLANIDGLVDYGEDFTDAAMAVEHIQTAYQVGKGMTAHVEELARQAAEAERPIGDPDGGVADGGVTAGAEPEQPEALSADAAPSDTVPELHAKDTDDAPHSDALTDRAFAATAPQEPELSAPLRPRRMRFSFNEERAE